MGGQHDLRMDDAALSGIVVGQTVPLIGELRAAPVCGGSHGGLALAALDDLDGVVLEYK